MGGVVYNLQQFFTKKLVVLTTNIIYKDIDVR